MAFVSGTETLTLKGTYQNPDGTPASGYIEIQLTQPVSDLNTKVSYTQKSMHYDLDAQGKVSVEIIKTGSTASDPVSLSRNVTVQITEVIEGANQYVWKTVIDTSALSEPGVFYLAEAAETVSRPANQYVSLGAFSTGQNTKMDKSGGTFTGPVTFSDVLYVGTPTFNSHPTPKSYVDTADNLRAPIASPTFTGTPLAPTAAANTSTTQIATTAFATTADNLRAPLVSPALTGTPTAPTAAVTTNTTQIATTAFTQAAVNAGTAPLENPLGSGLYYVADYVTSITGAPAAANNFYGTRTVPGRSGTINSIAIEVTTAGAAGCLVRLGVYKVTNIVTGAATLIADGGTVDASTTGVKTVTVSAAFAAGDHIVVGGAVQGTVTTMPSLRMSNAMDPVLGHSTAGTALATPLVGLQSGTQTGAFTSTTLTVAGGSVIRAAFRAT